MARMLLFVVLLSGSILFWAAPREAASPSPAAGAGQRAKAPGQDQGGLVLTALQARGEYLTRSVAMCIQCHTPRDPRGDLILDRAFQGGPVPIEPPPFPDMSWALVAPSIAGLTGYTEAEGIRLLTTGVRRNGTHPRPPMPPFRMTTADARAVVAYLRSLR